MPVESDTGQTKARELTRMRRIASLVLLAIFLIFLATFLAADPSFSVLLIRAMAEAGMVGGLADWFAVEALFRRPLGLPIPHTALLPNNQKRAANNIARFIDDYFLTPEQLLGQMRKIDIATTLSAWLRDKENAYNLATHASWVLQGIVKTQLQQGLPKNARDLLTRTLSDALNGEMLGDKISVIMRDALKGDVLDGILSRVGQAIEENRPKMHELIQERSRWWIASSVDKRIVGLLVEAIQSVITELSDQNGPLRADFEHSIATIVADLQDQGTIAELIDQGIHSYSGSQAFAEALDSVLQAVIHHLDAKFQDDPELLTQMLADALVGFANRLETDADFATGFGAQLEKAAGQIVGQLRPVATAYISQTISDWDSADLVARMEAEVGHDLQFIRINGSVLGAVLGGILFLAGHFVLSN